MSTPHILSVVVIGRNEGERLRRCLGFVHAMQRATWDLELIYVDSGSHDSSVSLAQGVGAKTITLNSSRTTAAMGRNAGWRAATGEFVLFLDGDTMLHPNFVMQALEHFVDPAIAVVWGHRREAHPERSLYNRILDLDWIYAPGLAAFCGGDALFRREVLVATNGFDESMIAGEEPELCRRIRAQEGKILHIDVPMTLHDLDIRRFHQYWQRAERTGHAYAEVAQRFAVSSDPFWTMEARHNRVQVLTLAILALAASTLSFTMHSIVPCVVMVLFLTALVLRSAWRSRWKSASTKTLLQYGVHSWLQQLPIFWGQVKFFASRRRGAPLGIVEYKRS